MSQNLGNLRIRSISIATYKQRLKDKYVVVFMCLKLLANIHCTFFLNEPLDIYSLSACSNITTDTTRISVASHRFVGLAYRKDRRQGESMNTSISYCPKCYLLTFCTLYRFIKQETKY